MKLTIQLPSAALLLITPLAVCAQPSGPHVVEALYYSFGGGLAGGFLGALLACWLCHRKRDSSGASNSGRR